MTKSYSIIFGITADPIHLGHEQAILNAVEYMRSQNYHIKRFILLPVYQPNLIANKHAPVAAFKHRYHMCKIVAKRLSQQLDCKIKVSKIEKKLSKKTGRKNYSYDTIRHIKLKNPLFMLSADHFQGASPKFKSWYKWQELLQICGLLINQRPENSINMRFIDNLRKINSNIFVIDNVEQINISSSQIRKNFCKLNKLDLQKLLANDVLSYILAKNIYH